MAWSSEVWLVSVVAVVVSGVVAAAEGHWRRGHRLHVGFAAHGGMWGDAILLPIANALIVPWLPSGAWLAAPLAGGVVASAALHLWWHGGHAGGIREHMWPSRPTGRWAADLSWAGWCHVVYVSFEVALLLAYVVTPVPARVVVLVSLLLTAHVPIGVLVPAWTATRRIFREDVWQTAVAIAAIWAVAAIKTQAGSGQ
jgi:hypothetical protein